MTYLTSASETILGTKHVTALRLLYILGLDPILFLVKREFQVAQKNSRLFTIVSTIQAKGLPPKNSETATPFVGYHFFPSRVSDKSGRYHWIWIEPRKILISHRASYNLDLDGGLSDNR